MRLTSEMTTGGGLAARRALFAALCLGTILYVALVVWPNAPAITPTGWDLVGISDDGRTVTVQVSIGGCGSGIHGVTVGESEADVVITVWHWWKPLRPPYLCFPLAGVKDLEARLKAPLSSRALRGCLGSGTGDVRPAFEDRHCRDLDRAARWQVTS